MSESGEMCKKCLTDECDGNCKPAASAGYDLKPCPFCGAEAECGNGFSPLESITYVWCGNKECELSPYGRDERLFSVEWWNTRS